MRDNIDHIISIIAKHQIGELPSKEEYYALASIQALDAEKLEASVQEIYDRVYPTGFKLSHHYIRSFLTK